MSCVQGRDVDWLASWLTDEYHLFRVFFLVFLFGFIFRAVLCSCLLYLVYRSHISV